MCHMIALFETTRLQTQYLMRASALIFLLVSIQGCATRSVEVERLKASLISSKIACFKYIDSNYPDLKCNKCISQNHLVEWSKSLHPAPIASWPTGASVKILFEDRNEFKMNLFAGNMDLKYSVLYLSNGANSEGGLYTGKPIMLDGDCGAHN